MLLEELRLNMPAFGRIELLDEGGSPSLGLALWPFESRALMEVCARGPFGLLPPRTPSLPRLMVLYSPLSLGRTCLTSPLIFIRDAEEGVMVCRPDRTISSLESFAAGLEAACSEADSARASSNNGVEPAPYGPPWEKKLAFDAVSGVVGVCRFPRLLGGVALPDSAMVRLCRAATLATVGVLRGNRLSGGSRRGWRFLLLAAGVAGAPAVPFRGRRNDIVRLAPSASRSARAAADLVACTAALMASSVVLVSVLESMGRLD